MRRKCLYKIFNADEWRAGFCLLITGGMMDGETAVVEQMDGTMVSVIIGKVKFDDALVGQEGATNGVTFDRIRELAEAERDGRIVIHAYGTAASCFRCPNTPVPKIDGACMRCIDNSTEARALAATEPKGDAT